jgi:hypothetical protein
MPPGPSRLLLSAGREIGLGSRANNVEPVLFAQHEEGFSFAFVLKMFTPQSGGGQYGVEMHAATKSRWAGKPVDDRRRNPG